MASCYGWIQRFAAGLGGFGLIASRFSMGKPVSSITRLPTVTSVRGPVTGA